jgi:hypothetical protein
VPPVTRIYFDSTLVAKFYLNEPGRDAVRRLAVDAGVVVTSGIAVADVAGARSSLSWTGPCSSDRWTRCIS